MRESLARWQANGCSMFHDDAPKLRALDGERDLITEKQSKNATEQRTVTADLSVICLCHFPLNDSAPPGSSFQRAAALWCNGIKVQIQVQFGHNLGHRTHPNTVPNRDPSCREVADGPTT
jgi:hypothetical protein